MERWDGDKPQQAEGEEEEEESEGEEGVTEQMRV